MMKYFCELKREFPVIVSGSLVHLSINRDCQSFRKKFLFPVGKIDQIYVFPMSFDECLYN